MKRIIFLSCASIFLCTSYFSQVFAKASTVNQGVGDVESNLSTDRDPDGDGDDKGYGYFPLSRPATNKRVFVFDPNYTSWAIYDEAGDRVNVGRASGGKLYCGDVGRGCKTIVGKFAVISKGGQGCVSSRFPLETHGGAPMPYCMHFSPKGYAIHGSNDVPDYNASHGCVRVTPTAAKWLNQNFVTIGTTVIVLPYEKALRNAVLENDVSLDEHIEERA